MSRSGSINNHSHSIYAHHVSDSGDFAALVESHSSFSPELTPSASEITAYKQFGAIPDTSNDRGKVSGSGQASIPALTFTLANTILGAGVLGVSHAFSEAGYVLGFLLLLISAVLSAFGLHLLQECARTLETDAESGRDSDSEDVRKSGASFYSVAHSALPSLTMFIDLAIAIKCFGVAISYLIVIGDLMPTALVTILGIDDSNISLYANFMRDRRVWITLFFLVIAMPLACLRNLNSLRFTSLFSILFIVFLSIIVTLYATDQHTFNPCDDTNTRTDSDSGSGCKGDVSDVIFDLNTVKTLPVFIFSFTCAQNIFTIYNELYDHTGPRVRTVIGSAVSLSFLLYVTVAAFSYYTFGSLITSNLLLIYPNTMLLAVMRIILSINIAFTFPLQINPCRTCTNNFLKQLQQKIRQRKHGDSETSDSDRADGDEVNLEDSHSSSSSSSQQSVFGVTALICAFAFGVAILVSNLGLVLSIVGATGSTLISYILPGLCYYMIHQQTSAQRVLAGALFVYGLCVVSVCMTVIFMGGSGH